MTFIGSIHEVFDPFVKWKGYYGKALGISIIPGKTQDKNWCFQNKVSSQEVSLIGGMMIKFMFFCILPQFFLTNPNLVGRSGVSFSIFSNARWRCAWHGCNKHNNNHITCRKGIIKPTRIDGAMYVHLLVSFIYIYTKKHNVKWGCKPTCIFLA